MTSKLFLDGIFQSDSDSPSSVRITNKVDGFDSTVSVDITGLIIGDPTFSSQNKWGTIINDVSNLQDLASLANQESQFSWISASTMCWKGTAPLSLSFDFYLINYKKNLKPSLEDNLKNLIKLSAIGEDSNATMTKPFKVTVHGGYAPNVLKGNQSYFTVGDVTKNQNVTNVLSNVSDMSGERVKGSVEVQFGNKSRIRNLLVSRVNVTESTIEVADQNGNNRRPLYYRVSVQFTGVAPLVTTDVDYMFDNIGK